MACALITFFEHFLTPEQPTALSWPQGGIRHCSEGPGSLSREACLRIAAVRVLLLSTLRGGGSGFRVASPHPGHQQPTEKRGVVGSLCSDAARPRPGGETSASRLDFSLPFRGLVPFLGDTAGLASFHGDHVWDSACSCGFRFMSQVLHAPTELQRDRRAAQEAPALVAPPWPRLYRAGLPRGRLTLPEPPSVKGAESRTRVFSVSSLGATERGPFSCPVLSEPRGLRGVMRTLPWTRGSPGATCLFSGQTLR